MLNAQYIMININSDFLCSLLCSKKCQLFLLIELNLQSTLLKELFEALKIVSTEQFIMIDILFDKELSYMYDLKLFF